MAPPRLRTPIRYWPGTPRPRAEPVVPMINVVFLLLVFFLLAAHFGDPEQDPGSRITRSESAPAQPPRVLVLALSGALSYGTLTGEAALTAAVADGPVRLQAAGTVEALHLARALARLSAAGAARVDVVTGGAWR